MDTFDFVIIGAGPAGEAATYKARELGATVAVIDRLWFGGSCPHIGCLPSKSLLDGAARHAANPARYRWSDASAARDYMVNRPAGCRRARRFEPPAPAARGGRDRLPRQRDDRWAGPGRGQSRRRRPTSWPRRTWSSRSGRSRSVRRSRASTRSRSGRTARRPLPASCRRACSSSAVGRRAARSPRSTSGSGFRRRSSSPARASPRPTTRATPRSCARRSNATASTVRTEVRALRARAAPEPDGAPRHRAGRRLDRRGPRDPARGRPRRSRSTTSGSSTTASTRRGRTSFPRDGRLRIADGLWVIGDPAGPELHTHQAPLPGRARRAHGAGRGGPTRLPGAAPRDVHRSRSARRSG